MHAGTARSSKLGLEALEARDVPAVAVTDTPTAIIVRAGNTGSHVVISRPTLTSQVTITDYHAGRQWTLSAGALDSKPVIFVGGNGADRVVAANAIIPVRFSGKGGNDYLVGGTRRDRLDGGTGNDTLIGGAKNDTLYGRDGDDTLHGQGGSDFLDDGGSAGDRTFGGDGDDFLALAPVQSGTLASDVNQNETPTCWVLAPLSAATQGNGIDLAGRITYLGDGQYSVKLLYEDGGESVQVVTLEGGRLPFEPDPNGDESWVILFHRAIMQELGTNWRNPNAYTGGYCEQVLPILTGRAAENLVPAGGVFTTAHLQDMLQALLDGKLVCPSTRPGDYGMWGGWGSVSTPKLIGSHSYHLLDINFVTNEVTLRNPWGVDGGTASGDPLDGIVRITIDEFIDSFDRAGIS